MKIQSNIPFRMMNFCSARTGGTERLGFSTTIVRAVVCMISVTTIGCFQTTVVSSSRSYGFGEQIQQQLADKLILPAFTASCTPTRTFKRRRPQWSLWGRTSLYDDRDDDEDDNDDGDDEDDLLDSLGDWRDFRKSLMQNSNVFDTDPKSDKTLQQPPIILIEGDTPIQSSSSSVGESNLSSSSSSNMKIKASLAKASTNQENNKSNNNKQPRYCAENYKKLKEQNPKLAEEYQSSVWVHETSTPEVGGLVVRNPMEVELYLNYRHSLNGAKLRRQLESLINKGKDGSTISLRTLSQKPKKKKNRKSSADSVDRIEPSVWYRKAQLLIEQQMKQIANKANPDGQIETASLSDEYAELLQLYLDQQENWQEVCYVIKQTGSRFDTLVLNRPMAFKLTPNLAQLILFGSFSSTTSSGTSSWSNPSVKGMSNIENSKNDETYKLAKKTNTIQTEEQRKKKLLDDFVLAFGNQCGIYIGGTDNQHQRGIVLHGIPDLEGATEIAPGTNVYQGGLEAAIQGVLDGKYSTNEFRFFVGKNVYEKSTLDVAVILGKYQPMACSRSVVLKQCIALPKPLWNEVNELCGGLRKDISELEMLKRDDIQIQIIDDNLIDVDDDDDEDDLDDDDEFTLLDSDVDLYLDVVDELDELSRFEDDDDDDEDDILYYRGKK